MTPTQDSGIRVVVVRSRIRQLNLDDVPWPRSPTGHYITGDISLADFEAIETQRTEARLQDEDSSDRTRLTLQSRADT